MFRNPAPSDAVTTGVGTGSFTWGVGDPSSLSYTGNSFDTVPDTPFKIGHLNFRNGTIFSGAATSVDLDIALNFDNIPEKNFSLDSTFYIDNTPNSDDPIASADTVSIGGYSFTFNVLEGASAGVDLWAKLTTGLSALPTGAVPTGADQPAATPFDPDPGYMLSFVGFRDPGAGGFVGATAVPAPGVLTLFLTGIVLLWRSRRDA